MRITINSEDEFGRLLSALADDLVDGVIHFRLYQDLVGAYDGYFREYRQSWTFWSLTLGSHLDSCIYRLCRAYDQYESGKPTVSLRNFLDTVGANLHLFDETHFRKRLKENPHVNSLAATPRIPDLKELQQHRDSVSNSDPLVKTFNTWRHNFYAHRSSYQALDPQSFAATFPLHIPDIEALLKRGMEIVNRYSQLYRANTYSTSMVGRDDYTSILKAVRDHLGAGEEQIQKEIERYNKA